ncbi:MAG: hypothetical protein GX848_06135 [Clostridiales bacterium]|nr:hypothetical protein [Clostridiales bacterium]
MAVKPKRQKTDKLMPLCSAADKMTLLIEELIEKLRMIVTDERVEANLDAKYIKELVAAMKDLTYVIRNLNDLPTFSEKFEMELAEKKHELDKSKLSQTEQTSGELTVTIEDPLKKWSK